MAALGRQVFDWHRLVPLTWACIAAQTPRLGERRRAPALLCKLPTASSGGGPGGLSRVASGKHVQDPECTTSLPSCPRENQRAPADGASLEREEVISSLLDMGFSGVHAHELLGIPGTQPRQLLDVVSELVLLGVNPEPVCVVLKKSPQLLKLPVVHVKKRSSYLRKLGLEEGRLKKVLHCCPEVFTMSHRDLDSIIRVLREKCLFTAQQVTEILHRCPHVLRADPGELEYKFQHSKNTDSIPSSRARLWLTCAAPWAVNPGWLAQPHPLAHAPSVGPGRSSALEPLWPRADGVHCLARC
ncbi:transcription termination factor 4, mitochondrial isoform 2-T2 [Glossophaga mutica]